MQKKAVIPKRALVLGVLVSAELFSADEGVERTISDLYAASQRTFREARMKDDIARAPSTFAPEWAGNMPAGETLTFADLARAKPGSPSHRRNVLSRIWTSFTYGSSFPIGR